MLPTSWFERCRIVSFSCVQCTCITCTPPRQQTANTEANMHHSFEWTNLYAGWESCLMSWRAIIVIVQVCMRRQLPAKLQPCVPVCTRVCLCEANVNRSQWTAAETPNRLNWAKWNMGTEIVCAAMPIICRNIPIRNRIVMTSNAPQICEPISKFNIISFSCSSFRNRMLQQREEKRNQNRRKSIAFYCWQNEMNRAQWSLSCFGNIAEHIKQYIINNWHCDNAWKMSDRN